MQYITKKQIIKHFAKYKTGENVILIHGLPLQNGTIAPAPLICTVGNIRFINEKAEKRLPKYRRSQIDCIRIDPDLIMYDLISENGGLRTRSFEHALLPVNETTGYLDENNCANIYRSKYRQFKSIIRTRKRKRAIKSAALSLVTLSICIYTCVLTFSKDTVICDILMSVSSLLLPLVVFAASNRRVERVHLK